MPTKNKKSKKMTGRVREVPVQTGGLAAALSAAGRGTLIACLLGVVLLLVATAIAYAQDDPDLFVRPLGYAITAMIALTAGFLASHRNGRQALLCGLLAAAFLLLLFAALSFLPLFASGEQDSIGLSLGLHAALLPTSIAGAYLGRRRGRR